MRLGKYLSSLTKPELEEIKEQLNLTDDEEIVFSHISKGRSLVEISNLLQLSVPSVCRREFCIKEKMKGSALEMTGKVPISEKMNLTIEEASEYSNIGINKLYELTNQAGCTFVLWIGKKRLIKRKEFEKFISNSIEI